MRILLDECVPRRLRRHFPGHEVRTVTEMGWSGLKNGSLLRVMVSQAFEVLVTVDKNLRYQQAIPQSGVALVVLKAPSNRMADLLPAVPDILLALDSIRPGEVIEIVA